MKRRRLFQMAVAGGLAAVAAPVWAEGSAGSMRRVGVLAPSTHAKEEITLKPFFDEMRRLGWVEGKTVVYDRVYAEDRQHDLQALAVALVARKPDLIYAPPSPAAVAARRATQTIPIVFATGTDPVSTGLVASMAHPGGNATGVISVAESLVPKLVEVLREILPGTRHLGLVSDPTDPRSTADRTALAPVAQALGLIVSVGDASNPAEFDAAVGKLLAQGVEAVITSTTTTYNLRSRLIELTNRKRVPVIGHRAEIAAAGALFSYGASLAEQIRRSAHLVDKVLRGQKPGDIAVEQPTRFELVVNMQTARLLGIKIPKAVLLRADEVIE